MIKIEYDINRSFDEMILKTLPYLVCVGDGVSSLLQPNILALYRYHRDKDITLFNKEKNNILNMLSEISRNCSSDTKNDITKFESILVTTEERLLDISNKVDRIERRLNKVNACEDLNEEVIQISEKIMVKKPHKLTGQKLLIVEYLKLDGELHIISEIANVLGCASTGLYKPLGELKMSEIIKEGTIGKNKAYKFK